MHESHEHFVGMGADFDFLLGVDLWLDMIWASSTTVRQLRPVSALVSQCKGPWSQLCPQIYPPYSSHESQWMLREHR